MKACSERVIYRKLAHSYFSSFNLKEFTKIIFPPKRHILKSYKEKFKSMQSPVRFKISNSQTLYT